MRLVAVQQRREPIEIVARRRNDRRRGSRPSTLAGGAAGCGLQRDVAGHHHAPTRRACRPPRGSRPRAMRGIWLAPETSSQ